MKKSGIDVVFEAHKLSSYKFEQTYNSRYKAQIEDIQKFCDSKIKARIYLSKDTNKIIDAIHENLLEIKYSASMHILELQANGSEACNKDGFYTFFDMNKIRQKFLVEKMAQLEEGLKDYIYSN